MQRNKQSGRNNRVGGRTYRVRSDGKNGRTTGSKVVGTERTS